MPSLPYSLREWADMMCLWDNGCTKKRPLFRRFVMSTRASVFHDVTTQLGALLPAVRVTRSRTLGWLVFGLIWSGSVSLTAVAGQIPLWIQTASAEQRLRRWLKNADVEVGPIWATLVPVLLASRSGQEVIVVVDPTPAAKRFTIVQIGILCRQRVLPIAWRVMPQQQGWTTRQHCVIRDLVVQVAAAFPPTCSVTLVADRGLTCAELVDTCRTVGWHFTVRISANPRQSPLIRRDDGSIVSLWQLVAGPGSSRVLSAAIFRKAGWRAGWLTIRWDAGHKEPWLLFSDRPGGAARVRDYRRRVRVEATYEDYKRRGWNLNASRIRAADRFDRLLLGLAIAYWWTTQLGLRVIRHGYRRQYDHAGPRRMSVVRLGRACLLDRCARQQRRPPLLFRKTNQGWIAPWCA